MQQRLIIVFSLLLFSLSLWVLSAHTRFTTDLTYFLPRGANVTEQLLAEQLREGTASRMILIGLEGGTETELAKASSGLAQALQQSPLFVYVGNGQQTLTEAERNLLLQHRYLLSAAVNADHFSPAALKQALLDRLTELASPISMMSKEYLPLDPTGEFLTLLQTWSAQRSPDLRQGVWFSTDGKRALLVAETRAAGFDIDSQSKAVAAIKAAVAAQHTDKVKLILSGPGVFSVEANQHISQDVARLSVIDTLFLVTLLWLVYRSKRLIFLSFVPLLGGGLVAAAGVSLIFGSLHGITIGFGTTLIGVANDYPIHLFSHMTAGKKISDTLRHIWPTVRLGVLSTIVGFSAMIFSGFEGLAQLGAFAIIGLLTAGMITRWLVPALAPTGFALPDWLDRGHHAQNILRRLQILRLAPPLLLVAAVSYIWLTPKALWNDDLSSLSPVSAASKQLDGEMRVQLGAPDLRKLIVILANNEEQALQRSEALATELQTLQQRSVIAGFDMAARYLPSQHTQQLRQIALPEPGTLRQSLKLATTGLPFKADLFEPFLADIAAAKSQKLLTPNSFQGTPLGLKPASLLFKHGKSWVALVPLIGVTDEAVLNKTIAPLTSHDVIYLDLKNESNRLVAGYRIESLHLLSWGVLGIAMLLTIGLRSWRSAGRVLLPMASAVTVTCALLVMFGSGLSLFHLVSLLLVVGIAMDYALFFNRPPDNPQEQSRTVHSLMVCNLTTTVAFGVLLLSHTSILVAIGSTVAIGALLALLFAAMMSP